MHRFCKVVTSVVLYALSCSPMYMHRFCKVVTSDDYHRADYDALYMHRFCKVASGFNSTIVSIGKS